MADTPDEIHDKELKEQILTQAKAIIESHQNFVTSELAIIKTTEGRTYWEHLSQINIFIGFFFLTSCVIFLAYLGVSDNETKNALLWAMSSLISMCALLWFIIMGFDETTDENAEIARANSRWGIFFRFLGVAVCIAGAIIPNILIKGAGSQYLCFLTIIPACAIGAFIAYYFSREMIPYVLDKYIRNETGRYIKIFGLIMLIFIIIGGVAYIYKNSLFDPTNNTMYTISTATSAVIGILTIVFVITLVIMPNSSLIFNYLDPTIKPADSGAGPG